MMSSAVTICFFLAGVVLVKCGNVNEFVIAGGTGKFTWQNCEKDANYPLNVTQLSLTPDPIRPGSVAEVSFTAQVNQDIGTTIPVQVDVEATFDTSGMTVDLCDYVQCHYKDFCAFIKEYKDKCPPVVRKLVPDCACPLKKDEYKVPKASFPVPDIGVRLEGVLKLKVNIAEAKTKVGCLEMNIYVR